MKGRPVNRKTTLAAALAEIAIWATVGYIMSASADGTLAPKAWHHTGAVCRRLALMFGRAGMAAERNYWKAVKA